MNKLSTALPLLAMVTTPVLSDGFFIGGGLGGIAIDPESTYTNNEPPTDVRLGGNLAAGYKLNSGFGVEVRHTESQDYNEVVNNKNYELDYETQAAYLTYTRDGYLDLTVKAGYSSVSVEDEKVPDLINRFHDSHQPSLAVELSSFVSEKHNLSLGVEYTWDSKDHQSVFVTTKFYPFANSVKTVRAVTPVTVEPEAVKAVEPIQTPVSVVEAVEIDLHAVSAFAYNSFDLNEIAHFELDKVVSVLIDNPSVEILVNGYASKDNEGRQQQDLELSKNRAEAISFYLVQQGVSPDQITTQWFGQNNPIATNNTHDGRIQNRRVEIRVK